MEIKKIEEKNKKIEISTNILENLPQWFGLPDSTEEYIRQSAHMDFLCCFDDDLPVGFIVLKENSKYCCEIYVMGILKSHHRRGIGRKLFESFTKLALDKEYEFIQVKTVESGKYREYDIGNCYYKAMGFKEMEVFEDLWDEHNPCQIYIKHIG